MDDACYGHTVFWLFIVYTMPADNHGPVTLDDMVVEGVAAGGGLGRFIYDENQIKSCSTILCNTTSSL